MSKHRKSWSSEDKEKIVLHSNEHGISKTVREFGVSAVSIYNWKSKYELCYSPSFGQFLVQVKY
jgi:transposase-like protein